MRTAILLSLVFTLAACGDEQQVGTDALWQVRCAAGVAGCSRAEDVIDLTVFDGQTTEVDGQVETVTVRCSLGAVLANNTRLMNVSISTRNMVGTQSHRLDVQNVVIDGSGAISGTGRVVIKADDVDLEGAVGPTPPSEATPCRISPITFRDREEGPAMSFELECRNISNPANPALTRRDLTFPNMSGTPASINVFNCAGL